MMYFSLQPKLKSILVLLLTAILSVGLFCGASVMLSASVVHADETVTEPTEELYPLDGYGHLDQPYIIASPEDFYHFRENVNNGVTYEGQYIVQTVDLDLATFSNFTPIGKIDGGNYFYGTYNGQGHTISGLRMVGTGSGESQNVALFGRLGGTVMNLGIESGYISGGLAASFAVNAASEDAVIYNCYSKAEVFGTIRAGGITDDFAGTVANCWYEPSDTQVPLSSFYVRKMYYCYSATALTPPSFAGQAVLCSEVSSAELHTNAFAKRLNENALAVAMNLYYRVSECAEWTLSDEGKLVMQQSAWLLEGAGTQTRPYLISSVRDFLVFELTVNLDGKNYYGQYFSQTENLDLQNVYNFVPIGIFNSDRYFYGVYDGLGHIIENIYIGLTDYTPSGELAANNNGLFGVLGGTVRNLGLESGTVLGSNSGSICSHGATKVGKDPAIFNCYSKLTVDTFSRKGGIADNFNGAIENCIYYNPSDESVILVSYSALSVDHCYSTGGLTQTGTYWGDSPYDSEQIYVYTDLQAVCDEMNSYVVQYARSHRTSSSAYAEWKLDSNGTFYFDGTFKTSEFSGISIDFIEQFPDEVIVVKLILCSAVVITLSIVIDVLWRKYRKKGMNVRRKEDDR